MNNLEGNENDINCGKVLCLYILIYAVNYFIKTNSGFKVIPSFVVTITLGVIYLMGASYYMKNIHGIFCSIFWGELLFIFLVLISLLRYPELFAPIMKRCSWTLFFCIPLFCLAKKVKNHSIFMKQTHLGCTVVFLVAVHEFFKHIVGNGMGFDYNMSLGYMLVFPVIYHISLINENRMYSLVVLAEIIIILLYGSRGPLLCICLYVLLRIIFAEHKRVSMQLIRVGLIQLFLFLVVAKDYVMDLIAALFTHLGVTSRTISLFSRAKITYFSGRETLWEMMIEKINDNLLLGWGVAGDLNFLKSYPHQLFLELILHFGIIIGGFISAVIIYKVVSKLFQVNFNDKMLLASFCAGFVPLMLSDTYLDNVYFWILLSFCMDYRLKIIG